MQHTYARSTRSRCGHVVCGCTQSNRYARIHFSQLIIDLLMRDRFSNDFGYTHVTQIGSGSARVLSVVESLAVSISCDTFARHFLLPARLLWFSLGHFLGPFARAKPTSREHATTTPQLFCLLMIVAHLAQSQFRLARFRTGHADFRTTSGNASTLPRSAGGNHFETLRKLCGM
jgi:hypothetical protein